MRIFDDITQTIGRTPLVRMQRLGRDLPATILLKLEFFNPLGSVKDRIGISMLEAAEKAGQLRPGMQVVEPTSGNTGVALAFACAAKGYPCTLVMPETMSMERRTLLILLGAKVVLTPGSLAMKGAVAKAEELLESSNDMYMPGQFDNAANAEVHRRTTALEIWEDSDGTVDAVVAGVGTGGTLTGVGSVLKQKKPSVQMIAVEPSESAVISGEAPGPHKIQGIGAGFLPRNLDITLVDRIEKVSGNDSLQMAKELIKKEGIPVGISSGAAVVAALRLASLQEFKGKIIIAIIPSCVERYLSTLLAEDARQMAHSLPVASVDPKRLED